MSATYVIRLKELEAQFQRLKASLQLENEQLKKRVEELEARPIPAGRPRKVDA